MIKMNTRLFILSLSIFLSLMALSWMGDFAIDLQAEGLEGRRLKEFVGVAENIRLDVKRRLDDFMQTESQRDYTEYQYYNVPVNIPSNVPLEYQQLAKERSPLGDELDHGLAYGHFQIEPDGAITAPFYPGGPPTEISDDARRYLSNLKNNLPPLLRGVWAQAPPDEDISVTSELAAASSRQVAQEQADAKADAYMFEKVEQVDDISKKLTEQNRRAGNFKIESLDQQAQQAQVLNRSRANVDLNRYSNVAQANTSAQKEVGKQSSLEALQQRQVKPPETDRTGGLLDREQMTAVPSNEQVEVRVEPFLSMLIPVDEGQKSLFAGQVFLLRHVRIEDRHILQGFQLNTEKLMAMVTASAARAVSVYEGMKFDLSDRKDEQAAYTASLDFGFGNLVVNLAESNPDWIGAEIGKLRAWYFGVVAVVFLVVALGVTGLWRSAAAQLKLARQKDDFISAVSHELRTPLTSIRMYTEMLEKDWIKTDDKRGEYYRNMRQESERLSRLIENVLDFSRIQRQRKRYDFKLGDINQCVRSVVDMMRPYAAQHGFTLIDRFEKLEPTNFDNDAVMQIVINLLDNAVKYARNAEDKNIIIGTRRDGDHVVIEVEDHGPGLPPYQRQ
ncbi:sensor histidine kinase, partial [Planctomycetota bacterium]